MSGADQMIFPDRNSTNFPLSVKNSMKKIVDDEFSKKEYLRYHQFLVYKYLIKNNKTRGIGIIHSMGFGKSILASALAEYYRKMDPTRKIIVLLPKSLQENLKKNIYKHFKQ